VSLPEPILKVGPNCLPRFKAVRFLRRKSRGRFFTTAIYSADDVTFFTIDCGLLLSLRFHSPTLILCWRLALISFVLFLKPVMAHILEHRSSS
jgi:hypothetical protein